MDLSRLFQAPLKGVERRAELRIQTWELGGFLIESGPRVGVRASGRAAGVNYWRSLGRKRGTRKGKLFLWRGEKWSSAGVELYRGRPTAGEAVIRSQTPWKALASRAAGAMLFRQSLSMEVGTRSIRGSCMRRVLWAFSTVINVKFLPSGSRGKLLYWTFRLNVDG